MAKARELKRRIRSVQNTKKITKTMELVSTSKLKRAQDRVVGARPYAQALAEVIGQLYSAELAERFPLLRQPGETGRGKGVRRAALLLITSNRGLCGAFNANLAAKHKLPAAYASREFIEAGGLICYAANIPDLYRRAASYVHKVLTGTHAADLPIEQPTKFMLAINLKAAKALGLTIPPSILARADEVIE